MRGLGDLSDFGEHIHAEDGRRQGRGLMDGLEDAGADKQIYFVSGKIIAVGGDL